MLYGLETDRVNMNDLKLEMCTQSLVLPSLIMNIETMK